jgi:hypothetical protein
MYTGEADAAALDANLQEVLELAALYEQADLKAACEDHHIEGLKIKTVVPLLISSHLHDLAKLKKACIEFIKANMAAVTLSPSFMTLQNTHPALLADLRGELGVEEEEEEEEEEQEEGPQRKRVKVG